MNMEAVTIEDCIDMQEKKGFYAVINDGKLINFCREAKNRIALPPASKQD